MEKLRTIVVKVGILYSDLVSVVTDGVPLMSCVRNGLMALI
jgi:hypothetical protein